MEINLKEICAINKYAASREETRYYLNGVYVHSCGDWVHFVATDGHRLIVRRVPNVDRVDWSFIIPRELLEKFKFSKRNGDLAELECSEATITITYAGTTTAAKAVDGVFPDYARIVPRGGNDIAPAVFNGSYCADFDAFAKVFGCDEATINPMGVGNPALVTFGDRDDVYGALMPKPRPEGWAFKTSAPF